MTVRKVDIKNIYKIKKMENKNVQIVQIVFTDIVKYSLRNSTQQEQIIQLFTAICKQSVDNVLKKYCDTDIKTFEKLKNQIIYIPTGDGLAFGFLFNNFIDIHISLVNQLSTLIANHNSKIQCEHFIEKGWCHCHSGFHVRFGVSEGKAIIYKDINGNRNIAGTPINEAARVMGLAGNKQAFFTESCYKNLEDLSNDVGLKKKFVRFNDVEVKHGIKLNVYQYLGEDPSIDNSPSNSIIQSNFVIKKFNNRTSIDSSDTFLEIVNQFTLKKSLDILKFDTSWVFSLFPSLALARLNKKRIRVLCPIIDEKYEKIRIALLIRLGCEVKPISISSNTLPEMFLFDASTKYFERGILFGSDNIYPTRPFATYYEKGLDRDAINLFFNSFENIWMKSEQITSPNNSFEIKPYDHSEIEKKIKQNVYQYSNDSVVVKVEDVQLDSLWFLVSRLYEWKLAQVHNALSLYHSIGAELFEPLSINFEEKKFSIITPPIVEEHNNRLVVLNGSHRSYFCRKNRISDTIKCIVIRGVDEQLPGIPVPFENVRIDTTENKSQTRIIDFDFKYFRHVESSIHPYEEVSL